MRVIQPVRALYSFMVSLLFQAFVTLLRKEATRVIQRLHALFFMVSLPCQAFVTLLGHEGSTASTRPFLYGFAPSSGIGQAMQSSAHQLLVLCFLPLVCVLFCFPLIFAAGLFVPGAAE